MCIFRVKEQIKAFMIKSVTGAFSIFSLLISFSLNVNAAVNKIIPYTGECFTNEISINESEALQYQLDIELKWISLIKSIEIKEFRFDLKDQGALIGIRDFETGIDLDCERTGEKGSIYCEPLNQDELIDYIEILSTSNVVIKLKTHSELQMFNRCKRIAPKIEDEELFNQSR